MAQSKFQLISERLIGRVRPSIAKKWAKLHQRQQKIEAQFEKLKKQTEDFQESLEHALPFEYQTEAHEGFRLEPDGRVYQVLCKCFECQAKLHNMSVIDAVEHMIKADLIERSKVAAVREHAYQIEAAKQTDVAKRQLIN